MKEIMEGKTEYSAGAPAGAALVAQAMSGGDASMRYKSMQTVKDWDRTRLGYRTVKRAFDILFSGCVLAVIAVPSILQQSFISVGNIIIQSVINSFGAAVMAGYSAAVKLNNMVITSLTTLGNGISNYTAQNLGAAKYDRIRAGFRAGLKLVWALCVPLVQAARWCISFSTARRALRWTPASCSCASSRRSTSSCLPSSSPTGSCAVRAL